MQSPARAMDAIAQSHRATGSVHTGLDALMAQVQALLQSRSAHPARTVVLVPYAQLMPRAARAWARVVPSGFAPRFESTMNWARSQGGQQGGFVPGPLDLCHDTARDLLAAQALLAERRPGRATRPAGRRAWWRPRASWHRWPLPCPRHSARLGPQHMRAVVAGGLDAPVLALELAVARVALEWVAASAYATDCLLGDAVRQRRGLPGGAAGLPERAAGGRHPHALWRQGCNAAHGAGHAARCV
jgi:ATP-dependent helicase/nuclease subunit B